MAQKSRSIQACSFLYSHSFRHSRCHTSKTSSLTRSSPSRYPPERQVITPAANKRFGGKQLADPRPCPRSVFFNNKIAASELPEARCDVTGGSCMAVWFRLRTTTSSFRARAKSHRSCRSQQSPEKVNFSSTLSFSHAMSSFHSEEERSFSSVVNTDSGRELV